MFSNKRLFYFYLKQRYNKIYWFFIFFQFNYQFFQKPNHLINLVTIRYIKIWNIFVDSNIFLNKYFLKYSTKFNLELNLVFFKYTLLYNFLFKKINYDIFFFLKKKKKKHTRFIYNLILTFRKNKLFVNLNNKLKYNYLFLSTGFFIKFFNKKKLFKKNKIVRTILIRYLRKIFLLTNLPNIILIIKKNPIFFLEFLNLLNQPIPYKFNEPLHGQEIVDEQNNIITKIIYFIFINNQSYTYNKIRKKGRIKRKILRKLVIKNHVID